MRYCTISIVPTAEGIVAFQDFADNQFPPSRPYTKCSATDYILNSDDLSNLRDRIQRTAEKIGASPIVRWKYESSP